MNFTLSIVVYLLMGLVLGWGIYLVMQGSYWLLIAGVLAYLFLFARLGCSEN